MYFTPRPNIHNGLPLLTSNFDVLSVDEAILAQLYDPEFYDTVGLTGISDYQGGPAVAEDRTALSAAALVCAQPNGDTSAPKALIVPPETIPEREFLQGCLTVVGRYRPEQIVPPDGLWDKLHRNHTLVAAGVTRLSGSAGAHDYRMHVPYVYRELAGNYGGGPKEFATRLAASTFDLYIGSLLNHPGRTRYDTKD